MEFKTPITLDELCGIIGHKVTVSGKKDNLVTGVNEIHSVVKGNISFWGDAGRRGLTGNQTRRLSPPRCSAQ